MKLDGFGLFVNDMDKMITSSNAMKHINKIDTSSSTKKIEFEPKELDDNLLTSLKRENGRERQR